MSPYHVACLLSRGQNSPPLKHDLLDIQSVLQLAFHMWTNLAACISSLILCSRNPCRSVQNSSVSQTCFPLGPCTGGKIVVAFSIPSISSGGGACAAAASVATVCPPAVPNIRLVWAGGSTAPPMTMTPISTGFPFSRSASPMTSLTVFLLDGMGFLLKRSLIFSMATTPSPPSSFCTDSRSCATVVVAGFMSDSVRVRAGFRDDLRFKLMVGAVDVEPGAGGALGVDFGYNGCGGCGSFGRVNF